jgi:hypothetical protein
MPPFGSEQMKELLASAEGIKNAIFTGEEFIGRAFRDPNTEEILDEFEEDVENCSALCSETRRILLLFRW